MKCTSINGDKSVLILEARLKSLNVSREDEGIKRRIYRRSEVLWFLIPAISFEEEFDELVIPRDH